jgi:hypothetical protein
VIFDPIWKEGGIMNRELAYFWLADQLGIPRDACHFGLFDEALCIRAFYIIRRSQTHCHVAGSSQHCAIGSDLDGGYGTEQTAMDLDSIADLQQLTEILARRGYSPDDITGIMHGNWLRKFEAALP